MARLHGGHAFDLLDLAADRALAAFAVHALDGDAHLDGRAQLHRLDGGSGGLALAAERKDCKRREREQGGGGADHGSIVAFSMGLVRACPHAFAFATISSGFANFPRRIASAGAFIQSSSTEV